MPNATAHIRPSDCSAERTSEGAWAISAIIAGQLRRVRYYGYTKRQAIAKFIVETNPAHNN